jgi:hypothetical protein
MAATLTILDQGVINIQTNVEGRPTININVKRGEVTVFYTADSITLYKGNQCIISAEPYGNCNLVLTGVFASMNDLKQWVADNLLAGNGGHTEIVQADFKVDEWHAFDFAPCSKLLIINDNSNDGRWCLNGYTDRHVPIKRSERITIEGITNANQVSMQSDGGDGAAIQGLAIM